jgi:uncharacterized protein (TIGR03435 family)
MRLGRTVVDMTDLNGKHDLDLKWTADVGAIPNLYGSPDWIPPFDPQGQTILAALREQLGLKLESRRGPVEVIMIDHVERPSPN